MLRIVCTVLFVSFFVFVQALYAQEVFKIGSPLPMTGAGAAFGEKFKKAYTMAIDEINAKGGINGKKIELVIEDTQAKPAVAVTNAKKLISSDKVIALVGGWSSGVALAVAPVAQDNNPPLCFARNDNCRAFYIYPFGFKKVTASDCPSNLMNAIGASKYEDCVSSNGVGASHTILVAGIAHKLFVVNLLPYCWKSRSI